MLTAVIHRGRRNVETEGGTTTRCRVQKIIHRLTETNSTGSTNSCQGFDYGKQTPGLGQQSTIYMASLNPCQRCTTFLGQGPQVIILRALEGRKQNYDLNFRKSSNRDRKQNSLF